eukprot:276352-Rhodomonas_salina.1
MAALATTEKEVVVEALRRFGYDAMDCVPGELQRDEETVYAFYEEAVASVRKLLWRSGVRLQVAMAWDSPAMIAAVVQVWDCLKERMGVERASFAHLHPYLSHLEASTIASKFNACAQKHKSSRTFFDERQLEEAFKFKD